MNQQQELQLDLVYLLLAMPWNYFCVVFGIQRLFWPETVVQLVPASR
jgi:hypothetical protein